MDTTELLQKIRRIEIRTNRLSRNIFAGEYLSAFKGRGMAFSEVREYQPGDPIRDIDWNVTARYDRPFVKVYEEERELSVLLLVDVSASGIFGTLTRTKRELIAEIAATLAFSCITNNDKVGVIFYTDRIEKYIPPNKGRKHVLHIISEILQLTPSGKQTNLAEALAYASNVHKRSCTLFILSDFIDSSNYADTLKVVAMKYDIKAIRVTDPHEYLLPKVGLLRVHDAETGEVLLINSSDTKTIQQYQSHWQQATDLMTKTFQKYNVDYVSASTKQDYVPALFQLFAKKRR